MDTIFLLLLVWSILGALTLILFDLYEHFYDVNIKGKIIILIMAGPVCAIIICLILLFLVVLDKVYYKFDRFMSRFYKK